MDFNALQDHLPPGAVEFVGNQVKLNLSVISGNQELVPGDEATETIAQVLEGLVALTTATNDDRAAASPPEPPVTFASKTLVGTVAAPTIRYVVEFKVDGTAFLQNLVDPLA